MMLTRLLVLALPLVATPDYPIGAPIARCEQRVWRVTSQCLPDGACELHNELLTRRLPYSCICSNLVNPWYSKFSHHKTFWAAVGKPGYGPSNSADHFAMFTRLQLKASVVAIATQHYQSATQGRGCSYGRKSATRLHM